MTALPASLEQQFHYTLTLACHGQKIAVDSEDDLSGELTGDGVSQCIRLREKMPEVTDLGLVSHAFYARQTLEFLTGDLIIPVEILPDLYLDESEPLASAASWAIPALEKAVGDYVRTRKESIKKLPGLHILVVSQSGLIQEIAAHYCRDTRLADCCAATLLCEGECLRLTGTKNGIFNVVRIKAD